VTGSWSGGFQLGFTVQNTGTTATHDWTVGWSWPGTQGIASDWNATFSTSGQSVSAASLSYNGALAAGGNTTFGLVGTGAAPTSLTGLTCKAD
jgi:cellulase/cellobiase CelA1